MPHPRFNRDEVARRGQEIYEQRLSAQVETPENVGKLISIDIETGDYEIGHDLVEIGLKLQAKHPGAALWGERIGFNAVYAVGGTLVRTPQ